MKTDTHKTVDDFQIDQEVIYIPRHAKGDPSHKDCEIGVVTSKNDALVFVKFSEVAVCGQGCCPEDLL